MNINQENNPIESIKNQIFDSIFPVLLIIFPLLLISSLLRVGVTGWKTVFTIQIIFCCIFFITFFFRKRLSRNIKIILLLFISLTASIIGLLNFGYFGNAKMFFIISVVFTSFFLGKKYGYWAMIFSVLIVSSFAYLYVTGSLKYGFNVETYINKPSVWTSFIISLFLVILLMTIIINKFEDAYKLLIEQAKEQEENYRGLFEQAAEGIVIADISGNALMVNEAFLKLSGYSYNEVIGFNITKLIESNELEEKPLRYDLLEEGKIVLNQRKAVKKDGSNIIIQMHSQKLSDGRLQSFITDITDRVKFEKELIDSEKKYRTIFEKSADGILNLDLNNSRFLDCNIAAVEMLEYMNKNDIINKHPSEISPEKQPDGRLSTEKAEEMINIALKKGYHRFEWVHQKADKQTFPVEVSLTKIAMESGGFLHAVIRDISTRKQAEAKLKQSEEKFRSIIENMPVICFIYDRTGTILSWNKEAENIYKYTESEAIGKTVYELISTPLTYEPTRQVIQGVFEGNTIKGSEWQDRDKNGHLGWRFGNSFPVIDDQGYVIYGVNMNIDITQNIEAEEELQRIRVFNDKLIETANVLIIALDSDGNIVVYNSYAEKLTGYCRNELLGKNWFEIMVPKDKYPDVWKEFNYIISDKLQSKYKNPVLTKSGEERMISWSNSMIENNEGRIIGTLSVGIDITEQEKAITAVKHNEEKLRSIYNSTMDAIIIFDENYRIFSANDVFNNLLEINEDELTTINISDYLTDINDKVRIDSDIAMVKNGEVVSSEFVIKSRSQRVFPVETRSRLINFEEKSLILTTFNDISERKRLEKEIYISSLKAEEEEERGRIAKDLHDGLGPLISACKIYLHNLRNIDFNSDEKDSFSKLGYLIDEALAGIKEISNNLSPHILRNFGLIHAVKSFIEKLKTNPNFKINYKFNLGKRYDEIIEVTLYRVLTELINNTLKYAGAKDISVFIEENEGKLNIFYKDDGIGFNYYDTIKENKGFGLYNIHSRINSIGGKINYFTEEGKGIDVSISLEI